MQRTEVTKSRQGFIFSDASKEMQAEAGPDLRFGDSNSEVLLGK